MNMAGADFHQICEQLRQTLNYMLLPTHSRLQSQIVYESKAKVIEYIINEINEDLLLEMRLFCDYITLAIYR